MKYRDTTALPDAPGLLTALATATDLIEQSRTVGGAEEGGRRLLPGGPRGRCDAYFLKFILQDWNDAQASVILRNCRAAMPPHGTVLIIEMIVPEGNAPSTAKELDITMLLFTRAGKEPGTSTASPFNIIPALPR